MINHNIDDNSLDNHSFNQPLLEIMFKNFYLYEANGQVINNLMKPPVP